MTKAKRAKTIENEESVRQSRVLAHAFASGFGAALVLDEKLRVLLATAEAERLVAGPIALGASAAKVLCTHSQTRELAQALVEGESISAVIPHPNGLASQALRVRSIALRDTGGLIGFILLLNETTKSEGDAVEFHHMWARNAKMREAFRVIARVAPEDVTVLVRGETGTGKELVAQAIHAASPRAAGPFRGINCAALPPTLLESELFGHVRGAFTGAVKDTQGHFQLAHRGTLFLDEIGELPLELQAKLLRVLETRTVLPVGAQNPVPIDVRIVSATHRALRKEVEAGRFRADLMYRLRVVTIFLPALRERRDDIALLCEKLVAELNRTKRRQVASVSQHALTVLEAYDWPGNIRELYNALLYAYAMGDGPVLQAADLPPELTERGPSDNPRRASENPQLDSDARRMLEVLERAHGNKNKAAKVLGISRVTLWRRLRELGLAEPE